MLCSLKWCLQYKCFSFYWGIMESLEQGKKYWRLTLGKTYCTFLYLQFIFTKKLIQLIWFGFAASNNHLSFVNFAILSLKKLLQYQGSQTAQDNTTEKYCSHRLHLQECTLTNIWAAIIFEKKRNRNQNISAF